jgi:hypothetical protein
MRGDHVMVTLLAWTMLILMLYFVLVRGDSSYRIFYP